MEISRGRQKNGEKINSLPLFVLGTALSATSSATCFFRVFIISSCLSVYLSATSLVTLSEICIIFMNLVLHRHLYATTEVLHSGHR